MAAHNRSEADMTKTTAKYQTIKYSVKMDREEKLGVCLWLGAAALSLVAVVVGALLA
jgi:hypothetical protein